ncbi:hypothetical protein NC652_014603 [Populus alba x Populus x berolinensis]|nr:hypothetical protein NC652_014603 [Populus alba x Populus x berolinensis]
MASSGIRMGLVLVLVAITCGGAMAQSSCTNTLMSLAPCLNYITGNSSSPSSSCCSQLGNVVQTSPLCLCSLLNNSGASLGITVNRTLALSLPGACKVQTPSINQCKAATAPTASATPPVSSPASSPADSSNQTPEPDITPSASEIPSASGTGSGSKTIPSSTGTSDGSIVKAPLHFVLSILFVAWMILAASCRVNFHRSDPMAVRRMEVVLAISLIATLWAGAMAQSSCTSVIISMSPCLNYITGNSSTPSSSCCTQLANVVKSQPQCLCEVVNGGASSLGINVNQTQALALPSACNVQTPSISRCNASSPTDSPAGTTNSPSAGTGSKTDNGTSDANSTKLTMSLLFFLLFITSQASTLDTI